MDVVEVVVRWEVEKVPRLRCTEADGGGLVEDGAT